MTVDTTMKVTLTEEELDAVKIVHNMLARLPMRDAMRLNNELPLDVYLDHIQDGLAAIYELATNGDIGALDG